MARRKKPSRRRSPKTVSIWDIGTGYISLSLLTGAILGNSPWGFISGASDIAKVSLDPGLRGLR